MKRKYIILIGLTSLIVVLDQLTKYAIIQKFQLHESLPIIEGFFDITYIRNTGAAFGLLAHADPAFRVPFFVIVPLIALGTIGYIFKKLPEQDLKLSIALSLVIGGAVGNLIDRVSLGFVVDFLLVHWKHQYHYPAFNVADAAICVGVGLLMLDLFKQGEKQNVPAAH